MAQKFLAPSSVRHDPEIFCWSFTIRMSRSAWLLSAATFDGHEDDTFHEHEFVNMVSPSWTSAVAW